MNTLPYIPLRIEIRSRRSVTAHDAAQRVRHFYRLQTANPTLDDDTLERLEHFARGLVDDSADTERQQIKFERWERPNESERQFNNEDQAR
jgi:hypothetical protein